MIFGQLQMSVKNRDTVEKPPRGSKLLVTTNALERTAPNYVSRPRNAITAVEVTAPIPVPLIAARLPLLFPDSHGHPPEDYHRDSECGRCD